MPSPVRLTDAEIQVLFDLFSPIAVELRPGFLTAVAETLAAGGERGPGAAYRAARAAQGRFIGDLRRAAETEGTSRYSRKSGSPRAAPGGIERGV